MDTNETMRPNVDEERKEERREEKKDSVAKLKKYDEIQEKVNEAINAGDIDTVLLLNELTLARNLQSHLTKAQQKQFSVIYVAFKGPYGVVKRAGIYNTSVIKNSEDAEDILISEDFNDNRVLAVPRNSVFAELLK